MDYVFVFTSAREEVARFYRDLVGLHQESEGDDATWFGAQHAKLAVHDRGDEETAEEVRRGDGFVVWFRVADVRAAYERARAAECVVGPWYEGKPYPYFFARDPDGRFIGVGSLERP